MAVNIQLEWTPNPSTLKYVVDQPLLPRGARNFPNRGVATEQSPLAARLFDIKGVTAIMVGTNFVTVTKGDDGEWDELNDAVMLHLDEHLSQGKVVIHPEFLELKPAASGSSHEDRIREVLDAEIRPAVAMDGGDITFERYEDGVVYLRMMGSCGGCPSSTATLKGGIESRLREVIPELVDVVAV